VGLRSAIEGLSRGKSVAASTVVSYAKGGLAYFSEFLTGSGVRYGPLDVHLRHIELFVTWLREHPRLGQSSPKNVYAMTKSVLLGLMDRGLIPAGTAVFPRNPFPGINRVKLPFRRANEPGLPTHYAPTLWPRTPARSGRPMARCWQFMRSRWHFERG
jgi:hypothetical protein